MRAAFLSGEGKPPDCSALLRRSGRLHMRLNKSAYGLADAPLLWWQEADRRLRALPLRRHPLDTCAYMFYNKRDVSKGLVTLHVDDMMIGSDHDDQFVAALTTSRRDSRHGEPP